MRKFLLYSMLFAIFFVAFDRIKYKTEEINGDILEYVYNFNEKSIEGEKIVLLDNRELDSIQYYVYEFSSSQYVVYGYCFMNSKDRYLKKYEELKENIVDYDFEQYMIKTINLINNGTYNDVMELLKDDLDNNLYMIY